MTVCHGPQLNVKISGSILEVGGAVMSELLVVWNCSGCGCPPVLQCLINIGSELRSY
jgi:hypothetical protein